MMMYSLGMGKRGLQQEIFSMPIFRDGFFIPPVRFVSPETKVAGGFFYGKD